MNDILDSFKLKRDKEKFQTISDEINEDVIFKGTNLWILVFAIFIASLGLNVNSTAVVIGAMLISPLMGPIIGLGFGMAINDLVFLRKALHSYLFSIGVGLATSTVYFLLSPISDAHSEILTRTTPNIYDVLIALFGGFAGILAISSKRKGNVIPGVAIATALMPPLCIAGYGIATLNFTFFFGASYLFLINTVCIAFAAFVTVRFLKFPFKKLLRKEDEIRARRIIWAIVFLTLVPSIYFGYDIVQQNKFQKAASRFIDRECIFPNNYLLKRDVDAKNKSITLTYGGEAIESADSDALVDRLVNYNLQDAKLQINQGFAYLKDDGKANEQLLQLATTLKNKEDQIQELKNNLDDLNLQNEIGTQVYNELKTQYPSIQSLILQPVKDNTSDSHDLAWVAMVSTDDKLSQDAMGKIEQFLKIRINASNLKIYFERVDK